MVPIDDEEEKKRLRYVSLRLIEVEAINLVKAFLFLIFIFSSDGILCHAIDRLINSFPGLFSLIVLFSCIKKKYTML
jgi:hypothetical protein